MATPAESRKSDAVYRYIARAAASSRWCRCSWSRSWSSRWCACPAIPSRSWRRPEASQADIAADARLPRPGPALARAVLAVSSPRALQGDFGQSVRFRRPAMDLVLERYGATLELGGLAVLVVIVIALPVGVYAAVRRGSRARLRRARLRRARPGGAAVLAGPAARARLRRHPAPAADLRPRHAAPRAPARDHARLVRGGRAHAPHALVHARRARHRVRQAGAHQGAARARR